MIRNVRAGIEGKHSAKGWSLNAAALELKDEFVDDVEVAHQVEIIVGVVEALTRLRAIKYVKRLLRADIKALMHAHDDSPYLVPQ